VSPIQEISQLPISDLVQDAMTAGIPLSGVFEITSRCNLRCAMFYVCEPAGDAAVRATELTPAQWLKISEEAVAEGLLFLQITGGEPLLRSDFFEIFEPLTTLGLSLNLYTNATLASPAVAARLAKAPPARMEVSIYGATAETYERITGVPGSYDRAVRGILALRDTGAFEMLIKGTLSQWNVGEREQMRDLAHEWGLPFSASWMLTPRRDGGGVESDLAQLRIPAEDIVRMEWDEENDLHAITLDMVKNAREIAAFYCGAGSESFAIFANGDMNACIDLPQPKANAARLGFRAAWLELRDFTGAATSSPVCLACELRPLCPICPGQAYLESGTLHGPVPSLCELAKERYRILKENTPGA
jgi:radical SAM protein with 4Fe4S-binding SPASM domain